MAIDLKLGTPAFHVIKGPPAPGVSVRVTVTNGPEAVDANQTLLALSASSTETSQLLGDHTEPLNAFAAGESREVGTGVQLDPGTWQMSVTIYDAQGNQLAQSDSQSVTIPGPQHHTEQFADSSQLQFTIEPSHVHQERPGLVKVDYLLSCTGSVDLLPGFPVSITLAGSDGSVADQVYNIEQGVRRGAAEPKFLHVGCGETKAGDTAQLTLTGDVGGAAAKAFNFTLTWKEDGSADVTPA
jgi:hypothetical protein